MARSTEAASRREGAVSAALEEVCGAAVVLDGDLRVVLATSLAEELLGHDLPVGASAPRLLYGHSMQRPLAEALAAGRAAQGIVVRHGTGGEGPVRVRAVPVGTRARRSWLLFFEDATGPAAEGVVEFHGMWTQDGAMKQMFRILQRVAESDAPVLVRGDTGAGKELVAHALHALSSRRKGPFRAINCAALPANLLESELFGHTRGAFTGAVKDAPGHMQLAHRGTLFLDEVAETPLELQAKLLRVLETGAVLPVGAREPIPVDVRIVSATHRALRKEVEAGRFRADLMYRLRVIPLFLPPLASRKGDIAMLTKHFVDEHNARPGTRRRIERIAPATQRILDAHDWPGNVRELKNIVAYGFAIGEGPVFEPTDLPPELAQPGAEQLPEPPPPASTHEAEPTEAKRILRALARAAGSRDRAAKMLGMSRVTLWRRMKVLGLDQHDARTAPGRERFGRGGGI